MEFVTLVLRRKIHSNSLHDEVYALWVLHVIVVRHYALLFSVLKSNEILKICLCQWVVIRYFMLFFLNRPNMTGLPGENRDHICLHQTVTVRRRNSELDAKMKKNRLKVTMFFTSTQSFFCRFHILTQNLEQSN